MIGIDACSLSAKVIEPGFGWYRAMFGLVRRPMDIDVLVIDIDGGVTLDSLPQPNPTRTSKASILYDEGLTFIASAVATQVCGWFTAGETQAWVRAFQDASLAPATALAVAAWQLTSGIEQTLQLA